MRTSRLMTALLLAAALAAGTARAIAAGETPSGADWQSWKANVNDTDIASLQRGARDFVGYCLGCHSLQYERWSRLGEDLHIPKALLVEDLIPPGEKPTGYIISPMIPADAEKWFGKAPPAAPAANAIVSSSAGHFFMGALMRMVDHPFRYRPRPVDA